VDDIVKTPRRTKSHVTGHGHTLDGSRIMVHFSFRLLAQQSVRAT